MTLASRAKLCMERMAGVNNTRPQETSAGLRVRAPFWGITREQLAHLLDDCRRSAEWDSQDNVRLFVTKFVEPRTAGSWMGLSLMLNQDLPQRVNLMISHSWDENAETFFNDVIAEMRDDEAAFICFLALYQGGPAALQEQLGDTVMRGPFATVLQQVRRLDGRMLVVSCEELRQSGQGLYSRMWCDYEIYVALTIACRTQFTQRTTSEHLFGSGNTFSSKRARCGNPSLPTNDDEKMIRHEIETMPTPTILQRAAQFMIGWICWHVLNIVAIDIVWCRVITSQGGDMGSERSLLYLATIPAILLPTFAARLIVGCLLQARNADGYANLDALIRRAAEFQEQHPGVVMNPETWKPDPERNLPGVRGLAFTISRRFGPTIANLLVSSLSFLAICLYVGLYLIQRWASLQPQATASVCVEWSLLNPFSLSCLLLLWRVVMLKRSGVYCTRESCIGFWQATTDVSLPAFCLFGQVCACSATARFITILWIAAGVGMLLTGVAAVFIGRAEWSQASLSSALMEQTLSMRPPMSSYRFMGTRQTF